MLHCFCACYHYFGFGSLAYWSISTLTTPSLESAKLCYDYVSFLLDASMFLCLNKIYIGFVVERAADEALPYHAPLTTLLP